MILAWIIAIPLIGGLLAWLSGRWSREAPRWVSLIALAANLGLVVALWAQNANEIGAIGQDPWLEELSLTWIPQVGISFYLAIDGLSLLLVALTAFVGIMALLSSWNEPHGRDGFFNFNVMWTLGAIIGVFLALDLVLFFFFWEIMLIPAYFLFLWGHERRYYAAFKFFIFTQLSGLLMLLSIVGLYFAHGQATGNFTFNYNELLGTALEPGLATWLMLGFFVGFAVKLGVVPFHSWLPDAYTHSPIAGTIILSALMAKTAGYGLIRFLVPLFPDAAMAFTPVALTLAVVGILYGAVLAISQMVLKRLVAYSSISHMAFVLLGVFAWNELALQGAIMAMVAHGIATGALFFLIGALQQRVDTRDLTRMGGLWVAAPRMGGLTMLFVLASVGLPGMANFIGEFLILVGTFQVNVLAAVLAALGIVLSAVYGLRLVHLVYQGPRPAAEPLADLSLREGSVMAAMVVVIVWLGLFPQPVLNTADQALRNLQLRGGQVAVSQQGEPSRQPALDALRLVLLRHPRGIPSHPSDIPSHPRDLISHPSESGDPGPWPPADSRLRGDDGSTEMHSISGQTPLGHGGNR
jgi:NADH-quinone oxidoreductase subunit M